MFKQINLLLQRLQKLLVEAKLMMFSFMLVLIEFKDILQTIKDLTGQV